MTKVGPTRDQVVAFLASLHGEPVSELAPLDGGFWSSAFAYRLGGRELVLRIGSMSEGFEMDRWAMAFAGTDLPVPEVLDIGAGLGGSYAISVRHHGRFLEDVRPDEADRAGPALMRLLAALRAVPAPPSSPSSCYQGGAGSTWRRWLTDGLVDDPRNQVSGWRATLAADPALDRLFRACARRIGELLEACPERRDLVHGDLLHGNVLVADDASEVTAVFSWKCSARGDSLYDVAWCTFWGTWHPGIAALHLWDRVGATSTEDDFVDAALRHHCYELQIGASHLGWHAWTDDDDGLRRVAAHTAEVLERGPFA